MNKKILIVDDEKDSVTFLERALLREGFGVVTAFDGAEAKAKILQDKPDMIILDLVMPKLDGWQVLLWLRKEAKLNIPTIIVSAKGEMDDIKKGYNLEADTYLVKPLGVEDVLSAIRALGTLETNDNN